VEVILIDNNSSDGTAQTAREVWGRLQSPFDFRVVFEPELGLAYARRKGVMEARCECLVFCDDDNWLSQDYLSIAAEILSDLKVGATGGQAEPIFDGAVPPFVYSHGQWFALGIQAISSGDVTHSRGFLWGAGLAVRRSDLLSIYRCPVFPIVTDRAGAFSFAMGNDSEICWALTVLGKKIMYDDRLKLYHFMPPGRLKIEYLRKLINGAGWHGRIDRFAAGLNAIDNNGRMRVGFKSLFHWLRNFHRLEERRYHASIFCAACGRTSMMDELERKLYVASQWLRATRNSSIRIS
jgi:glycosyltransferase involved in cell wall biosynthesis